MARMAPLRRRGPLTCNGLGRGLGPKQINADCEQQCPGPYEQICQLLSPARILKQVCKGVPLDGDTNIEDVSYCRQSRLTVSLIKGPLYGDKGQNRTILFNSRAEGCGPSIRRLCFSHKNVQGRANFCQLIRCGSPVPDK